MPDKTAKKTSQPSHLKDLLMLFAVPAGIAVFATVVIYVPRLFANPQYDFIYSFCDDYDCGDSYYIDGTGHIAKNSTRPSGPTYYNKPAMLRYYDTSNDSTRNLTLEEAQGYRLNTSSKSPDGYTLSREETDNGFLFWGDYNEGWYLKNGAKKKKAELSHSSPYYWRGIAFLGWVDK